MAARLWAAAATLNPPLLTLSPPSSSRLNFVSPARRRPVPGGNLRSRRPAKFVCRRAKNAGYDDYKFPDPIPEFAVQETSKFKEHMLWRLEQKKDDYFGEHVEEIVDVCTEILGTFLEHDYCGPGTLLVHPFLDMKGEIKERGLPGAPQAARAAIAWAEKNIDKDWKAWTGEY
ncbi:protein PLASTID REDOX INSENSITIVE 2, chloroplastic [Oryza brachyantha]|uniref:Protein PLASTID REDOX INSENSITIVE 2, chloroplastic n=1 Tax=Oryza brachyantha TaxID=4533 RepID=J3MX48_ORYBR|nr:protein PLASTID REDOX INSENSITIVE 2, chloroplastic [Oryza brachyantha]